MKESVIQRAVMDYLQWFSNSHKLYFFRSGAGNIKTEQGHYFKTGKPGCPDISVCYQSKYWGIELKGPKGRQSALQKKAEKEILAAGGQYLIIRSLDDIKRVFPFKKEAKNGNKSKET